MDPISEISRALGALEGTVGSLAEIVRQQGKTAEDSREGVRREVRALTDAAVSLRHDVETLMAVVKEMQPTVSRMEEVRSVSRGVIIGVGAMMGLVGGGSFAFVQRIIEGVPK